MKESLLKSHFALYPEMEAQDAVKLCYQSAYGPGHLIRDEQAAVNRLVKEIQEAAPDASVPPFEQIGGGMSRLNLACPAVRCLSPKTVARMMMLTAAHMIRNDEAFRSSLEIVQRLAACGEAPFSCLELEDYLAAFSAEDIPSHSETYRSLYHPAYRVVLSELCALLPVIAAAEKQLEERDTSVVVIDGPCAGGKSTLGSLLAQLYDTQTLRMDDFFLPPQLRTPGRFAQPGGNVHYERFLDEVLIPLSAGGEFTYRRFSCSDFTLHPQVHPKSPVTVIEGSYSHHPYFREVLKGLQAIRVYLHIEEGEQLRRLALRNPEKLEMFRSRWIPLEKKYFEAYDILSEADFVIHTLPREAEHL